MMKRMVVLKRCELPPPAARLGSGGVRYGECRRNHAASMGGYAVDGCREFMAEGGEGTVGALRCAACGCHRSFHRRMVVHCCCCCCCADGAAAAAREHCSSESSTASSNTTAG